MLEELTLESPEIKTTMEYFDLDEMTMKIYLLVLKSKEVSISSISILCNCDRTKSYRVVEYLVSLGLLEETGKAPRTVVAVRPERGFGQLIENEKERLDIIKTETNRILPRLATMYQQQEKSEERVYSIVGGIIFQYARIIHVIKEAKSKIDLIIPFEELKKQFYTSLPEEIKKKGFTVRLISNPVTKEQEKFVNKMKNCEIKFVQERINRMIISDKMCLSEMFSEQMRYTSSNVDTTGFITNSDIMIKTLQARFDQLWRKNGT